MHLLLILWLAFTIIFFFFGNITSNNKKVERITQRFILSVICSAVLSLIIGLPLLGIYYLIAG